MISILVQHIYIYALNVDGTIKWKQFIDQFVDTPVVLGKDSTIHFGTGAFSDKTTICMH